MRPLACRANVPHSYRNLMIRPRDLVLITPGGFENVLRNCASSADRPPARRRWLPSEEIRLGIPQA